MSGSLCACLASMAGGSAMAMDARGARPLPPPGEDAAPGRSMPVPASSADSASIAPDTD